MCRFVLAAFFRIAVPFSVHADVAFWFRVFFFFLCICVLLSGDHFKFSVIHFCCTLLYLSMCVCFFVRSFEIAYMKFKCVCLSKLEPFKCSVLILFVSIMNSHWACYTVSRVPCRKEEFFYVLLNTFFRIVQNLSHFMYYWWWCVWYGGRWFTVDVLNNWIDNSEILD